MVSGDAHLNKHLYLNIFVRLCLFLLRPLDSIYALNYVSVIKDCFTFFFVGLSLKIEIDNLHINYGMVMIRLLLNMKIGAT